MDDISAGHTLASYLVQYFSNHMHPWLRFGLGWYVTNYKMLDNLYWGVINTNFASSYRVTVLLVYHYAINLLEYTYSMQ